MAFLKRFFLFGLVNILVIVTITVVATILGQVLGIPIDQRSYQGLLILSLIWGMGGAFISLLLSKVIAKWAMGVQIIEPGTRDPYLRDLVQRVHRLARSAGMDKMPEVGIYESPEVNAFATGPGKNSSLVAVSTGLLQRMNENEVDGVLGHEISHIVNGDMVTMTLIQGVVNAFVIFFARILASVITTFLRGDNERGGFLSSGIYFMVTILLEILLGILGSMVVAYFSRHREFRADAGSAKIAGRQKMIQALRALQNNYEIRGATENRAVASLKISGKQGGFLTLFSTHPPLEERIRRLSRGI